MTNVVVSLGREIEELVNSIATRVRRFAAVAVSLGAWYLLTHPSAQPWQAWMTQSIIENIYWPRWWILFIALFGVICIGDRKLKLKQLQPQSPDTR